MRAKDILVERPKPTLRLNAKDLPDLKNLKVGQKLCLTVEVKVKEIEDGEEYDPGLHARFNVLTAKVSKNESRDAR